VIAKKRSSITSSISIPAECASKATETIQALSQQHSVTVEKYLASDPNQWSWLQYTCVIANGKVVLNSPDCPLEHGIKIAITNLQLQILFPAAGSSLRDLSLVLSDGQSTRFLIKPPTLYVFQSILRRLVIAMKLHNVMSMDLTWIYHQSEGWRKNKKELTDISRKYSTVVKASSTLSTILNSIQSTHQEDSGFAGSSAAPSMTVLQAAEALDGLLTSLNLPSNFPGPEVVESAVGELQRLNRSNHQLLSDLLLIQVCIDNVNCFKNGVTGVMTVRYRPTSGCNDLHRSCGLLCAHFSHSQGSQMGY